MDKPVSKDEERFNKAVDIYVKKYQLNIRSLIKFIEEKIAVTPETKNIIVTEILNNKSQDDSITKDVLKMYLHMVAAAQTKVDIRGKKIESFHSFYRLAFWESKSKQASETKTEAKDVKNQQKSKKESKSEIQIKEEKRKASETIKPSESPHSFAEEVKQSPHKNKHSNEDPIPQKALYVIVQDVFHQNRTSSVGIRTEASQEVHLKLPEAEMMSLKSSKSVQVTGYDKYGQNYLNPIIKFHIVYGQHSVFRRYSEFERLMNDLGRRYEGFILPELPPKEGIKSNLSYFWGVDEAFLNERQIKLEQMLNTLLSSKFVNKDEVLESFLTIPDYQIRSGEDGGIISYLKPITTIALNTKELKNYGVAYYNYLKEFSKAEISTAVTAKYKEVESLLNLCLSIDNYRNAINANFEKRRDIFKELKMDKDDRNLTMTKFDKLSSTSASQIKNLGKEVSKYLELKSQQSWLSYLIREKEAEVESGIQELKNNKEQIVNRINTMEANLLISIEELRKEKISYLESVGEKMIEWRKAIHP